MTLAFTPSSRGLSFARGDHITNAVPLIDVWLLADLHERHHLLVICDNDRTMDRMYRQFQHFDCHAITLPAWDCLPYDRASPHPDILAKRAQSLAAIEALTPETPAIILTTLNASLQKYPPIAQSASRQLTLTPSMVIPRNALLTHIRNLGFHRTETVREVGEYSLRGSIIDIFAPANAEPVRIDFFGDEVESLRNFDAYSQISTTKCDSITITPIHELQIDTEMVASFRRQYRRLFGTKTERDPLYLAISEGRHFPGYEHWLPLFYKGLVSLFTLLPKTCLIVVCQNVHELLPTRTEMIVDHYQARLQGLLATGDDNPDEIYRPIPSELLYLDETTWHDATGGAITLHTDRNIAGAKSAHKLDIGNITPFHAERLQKSLAETLPERLRDELRDKKLVICCASPGNQERIINIIADDETITHRILTNVREYATLPKFCLGLTILPLETGFTLPDAIIYADQDIFGTPGQTRTRRTKQQDEAIMHDVSQITHGDYCVHQEYGIGRYLGLKTLQIKSSDHDCLELEYANDDKLFLPVENIDLLSRHSSADTNL
ncbi:MAG: CarD family transcriptional regulator, partial [Pseudomonadota bacterium]